MNKSSWELMNELERQGTDFEYEENEENCLFTFEKDMDGERLSRLALEYEGDFYRKEDLPTGEVKEYGITLRSSSELSEPSEDPEEHTSYA